MMISAAPPPAAQVMALPPCGADTLSLGFDDEGGAFHGMSHAGTLLVVRNIGPAPCRLPSLPRVSFQDGAGGDLPLQRQPPVGMHPGPVMVPVGLAPGAEATATLYWVSGPVYTKSRCLRPARVTVTFGDVRLQDAWPEDQLCGQAGKPATFDQPPLRADPTL